MNAVYFQPFLFFNCVDQRQLTNIVAESYHLELKLFCFPDHGKRVVISKDLQRYLSHPKGLCAEIHDFQKFLCDSRPGHEQQVYKNDTARNEEEDESLKTNEEVPTKHNPQSSTAQISNNKRPKSTTGKNPLEGKKFLKQPKSETQTAEEDQLGSHRSIRTTTCYSSGTIASCAKRMLNVSQTRNGNKIYAENESQVKLDGTTEQPVVNVNNISFKNASPQLVTSKFKYSRGSAFKGGSTNSINSITFQDVPNNESHGSRKHTPVSLDEINPKIPPQIPPVRTSSADSNKYSICGDTSMTALLSSGCDENNNVEHDRMAVSPFRAKNVLQNPNAESEGSLSARIATLTPNSAQRQVQLVLKKVCLLDPNMQERKVVSNAQRMIQQTAQTAASSSVRITDISRPSTSSNVTTLSMDGKLLDDQQLPEKMSGLEGYMNTYYREKTNSHSFQIGDLLPAVDDHNNKITRSRRGNTTTNEGSNSIPDDINSQATQSTLLQNEDNIFLAKEGIELIRFKERQQSVSNKK